MQCIIVYFVQLWKDWFDTEAPEDMPIPDGYSTSLNTFHKLLLIRSWCPDRTIPMAKVYVAEVMGKQVMFRFALEAFVIGCRSPICLFHYIFLCFN